MHHETYPPPISEGSLDESTLFRAQLPKQPWRAVETVSQQQRGAGDGGDGIGGQGDSPSSCQLRDTARGQWVPSSTSTEAQQLGIGAGGAAFAGAGYAGIDVDGNGVAWLKRTPSNADSRRPLWKPSGCGPGRRGAGVPKAAGWPAVPTRRWLCAGSRRHRRGQRQ